MQIVAAILMLIAAFGFVAAIALPPYLMERLRRLKEETRREQSADRGK